MLATEWDAPRREGWHGEVPFEPRLARYWKLLILDTYAFKSHSVKLNLISFLGVGNGVVYFKDPVEEELTLTLTLIGLF